MPQALVSDQLNRDVMQGFLSGFQHASALIQSRQQQEQENQRAQAKLDADAKEKQDTIRNQWAMKAMELGVKADEFKRQTAKEKSDTINRNMYSANLDVLKNRRQAAESFLANHRSDITKASASSHERYIRDTDNAITKLAQVPTGADGIFDPNALAAVTQESSFLTPEYTPEYIQRQKNKDRVLQDNADNPPPLKLTPEEKAHAKLKTGIDKSRNAVTANLYEFQTAENMVITGRKQYGSEEAWSEAAQSDPRVKEYRAKALGKLSSSNSWSPGAIPFIQSLSDPSIVGDDIAHLVNSTRGDYNDLASPTDYNQWANDIKDHPDYKKLHAFMKGNAADNAAANVPDQPAPADNTQGGGE